MDATPESLEDILWRKPGTEDRISVLSDYYQNNTDRPIKAASLSVWVETL